MNRTRPPATTIPLTAAVRFLLRTVTLAVGIISAWIPVGAMLATGGVWAESRSISTSEDWFSQLSRNDLRPGDEMVLSAGVYSDERRLVLQHRGTAESPIIIRAGSEGSVVLQRPDAKQNTLNLEGCQHLVIRGIEITGGATAIRIGDEPSGHTSHDIVLEDLHIHHIGGVAVTCNYEGSRYERMTFRRNHIHHTSGHGEAFYLGANHAKAIFRNSIISNNYLHHLNGPDVSQGDGIEIKHGSYGNRIEHNIIHNTNYPGITVYGTQGNERNRITGNFIFRTGDHGIQAAADAIIRGNWIADAAGGGIYSREHQGARPGNLVIENNYIVAQRGPAIRIIGSEESSRPNLGPIMVRANRMFAAQGQPAIRIDNRINIQFQTNQGTGDATGGQTIKAAFNQNWTPTAITSPKLPSFDGNPAMTSLTPATLADQLADQLEQ